MDTLTSGLAVYMSLCLWLTISAVESNQEINDTIYIENGAASVNLSCGDVPQSAVAIDWFVYKSDEWLKLLKFYHTMSSHHLYSYNNAKYDIGESVNTSLLIKNIKFSDSFLYKCGSAGGPSEHSYTTMLHVLAPPKDDYKPALIRGDPSKDLTGPYLENVNEYFTCYIRKVLPGKCSTSFKFYYDGKLRLESKARVGEVVESTESDGTKLVEWNFTTSFSRSDNGGSMRCHVNWKAGPYNRPGLKSINTENVQVRFQATRLALAQFPASAVKEGTVATFNCSSDEANPPRLIHWNQGSGNAKYKPGRYHALSVESTLRIAVDRTMNQEIISCFTEEDKRHDRLEEKITLSVTFEATTIEMTEKPQVAILGRVAQFMCKTDSAYPNTPSVLWYMDETLVSVNNNLNVVDDSSSGENHGQKTKSRLRFTIKREMNMQKIKCLLGNNVKKVKEHVLNIKFKPTGMDLEIGEAVKENTLQSVQCKANSANPASSVGMVLVIDGVNQTEIEPDVTETHGSDNGMVKAFEFRFTTDRCQNGKMVECHLLWNGRFMQINKEQPLNITFEATRIEMTEEPEVGYEGRVANFVCETDSAYPYSPSVLWFVDETPVNTKNGFTVVNNPLNGENHGNKTYSILRFIRKREMNMKRIKCMLGNNVEKVEEHILNVKFKPTGLDLEIGEAVKENTLQSVECKVNSANPASSVGMVLVIDGVNQTEIEPDVTETHGSDNGMVKTFVFMFTTERSQNEKMVECRLLWDGTFIEIKKEQSLNITFEATRIEMPEEPEVGYEGRVANFVCETDSAYPYSPSVLWFVDETPVNTKNGFTVVNNPLNGENHGNKTYSILRFIRKREMNMKRIKCMLGNNVEKVEEHILNVKFKPTGLDLEIGEAVKENTLQSVECKVNSANPASSVGMVLVIDGVNQTEIEPDVTETHGSDNGMVKTFVFMFTTERSQNEKMVECRLLWDGTFIEIKKEQSLNITYPPEVFIDDTTTPAVEYSTRNLTCRISGGNPSDPKSYDYQWMYRPTYLASDTDIPSPYGSYVTNGGITLQLKNLGYKVMAGTYKCSVTGVGGQNSGRGTLEVYCTCPAVHGDL